MLKPEIRYLNDYVACAFNVESVHLHFDLHETETLVTSVMKLTRKLAHESKTAPLQLDGNRLELQSVAIDGKTLAADHYHVDENFLTIADVPDKFTLETRVRIEPHKNTQLMGLYRSRDNYCTQCEAEGFRHITYYFDRPDVLSRFTTTISADKQKYPYLLSNGNLLETRDLDNGRHWVCWEDPSLKPCYLFALVAGDFDLLEDTFTTMSGREVALQLYVEKGFGHQADYALGALKRAMAWDETRWGREYDLDMYMIVAVSNFNMGAMENKGLNIFNTKYVLAQNETATDQDYLGIESVIGHEYFHNWSGNRVTCRDWFQITLKEGLTVFRDQEFTADLNSRAVTRLDTVNIVRNQQFIEDAGPLAHPIRPEEYIEINNFYTLTVYRKGAEVIRMVETLLTPPVFRQGLDLYFHRYDGCAVTTEEFLMAMEEVSHHDLSQFRRWYSQAGTPKLTITDNYNELTQTYQLSVSQSCLATPDQPDKKPFYLPFAVGLVGNGAQQTHILTVSQASETFTFEGVTQKPIPSLLRQFSAPVNVDYDYTDEALAYLWEHDEDSFARWNAGQLLASRLITHMSNEVSQKQPLSQPTLLVSAFKMLLAHQPSDLSFLSRLLTLPAENYLHQQHELIDVHDIFIAREHCIKILATELHDLWLQYYEAYSTLTETYHFTTEAVGQRSMKNLCLYYLVASGSKQDLGRAYEQFEQANNMTDRLAALLALNHSESSLRTKALDAFYQQWQQDPLVVNKWLHLQATSNLPNTFERILSLMQHEAFDLHNPNNVYALVCGFGTNHTQLHDPSGRGYQFIADQVIYLNRKNPQVAARVIQPLTQWRRFKEPYGKLMQSQLLRIAKEANLSSDIHEIIKKTLPTHHTDMN